MQPGRQIVPPLTQVAAVCYRCDGSSPLFLLVRTSSGKWTFPKGHHERGCSAPEAAALEAKEEAGVVGRVAAKPFGSYLHRKPSLRMRDWDRDEVRVLAFLLEVRRTLPSAEADRTPRWFTPDDAKERLARHRPRRYRRRLDRLIDRALRVIEAQQNQ
jgi:8-oxo-dGTP pyrophosphatase MutT (NUDIX family)